MNNIIKKYEDITSEEWKKWRWTYSPYEDVYIRTVKRVEVPDDGFYYLDVTSCSNDTEQYVKGLRKDE